MHTGKLMFKVRRGRRSYFAKLAGIGPAKPVLSRRMSDNFGHMTPKSGTVPVICTLTRWSHAEQGESWAG